MASFVLMQPPETPRAGAAALPVFVRDGFSVAGLLLGPLWLAWHRLWLPAALMLAVLVVLNAAGMRLGVETAVSLLSSLAWLWVGLEGSAMRLAGLRRRGYADAGVIEAGNRDDAELRFAAAVASGGSRPRTVPSTPIRVSLDRPSVAAPAGTTTRLQGES